MTTIKPKYSIGTWNPDKQSYTPQRGLTVPSLNISLRELRSALKQLRKMGYTAHRIRLPNGGYDDDYAVLVERTDNLHWKKILKGWRRRTR